MEALPHMVCGVFWFSLFTRFETKSGTAAKKFKKRLIEH